MTNPELLKIIADLLEDYRTEGCPDSECLICQQSNAVEARAREALAQVQFEKKVYVRPAYDLRSPIPSKNYGIHACEINFILHGPKDAVYFLIYTDWFLPHVQQELQIKNWNRDQIKPEGYHVGYHSPIPLQKYDSEQECDILPEGKCYSSSEYTTAATWIPEFLAGGTEWLWPQLETYYNKTFGDKS